MIDQKAIDAHQWIVDVTNRQPAWWAENLAWAYVAFGIIGVALRPQAGGDLLWTGILIIAGVAMVFLAKHPPILSFIGAKALPRLFFWVDVVMRIVLFIGSAANWNLAYIANSCIALSFLCFAACKPPQPRKRRESVAHGSAA
jgi:hypothetical protein